MFNFCVLEQVANVIHEGEMIMNAFWIGSLSSVLLGFFAITVLIAMIIYSWKFSLDFSSEMLMCCHNTHLYCTFID